MKMSILFGVCQMSFGVVLSLFNHRFFRRPLSIYTEFLPQIIFLESIFGYLSIMIIYKWMAWSEPSTAPGLLNTLIYMFLKPGTVEAQLYAGQVYYFLC
jgi:V-type H+-transporting ATPase subunit a